jgi:hypothetical protein
MNKTAAAVLLAAAGAAFFVMRLRPAAPDARRFVGGLPTLTPDMRLTVARLDSTITAQAEDDKVAWGVDWGTTKASLTAPVRVHYAVDLSGDAPVEFRRDPKTRAVVAVFRDPEVQAVEVFSRDKRAVVQAGWGRLAAFSGQALVDRLDAAQYDEAKEEAASPRALAQVRALARPELAKLVADFLKHGGSAAPVSILFRSDP